MQSSVPLVAHSRTNVKDLYETGIAYNIQIKPLSLKQAMVTVPFFITNITGPGSLPNS
jgi:hypothetical protein